MSTETAAAERRQTGKKARHFVFVRSYSGVSHMIPSWKEKKKKETPLSRLMYGMISELKSSASEILRAQKYICYLHFLSLAGVTGFMPF